MKNEDSNLRHRNTFDLAIEKSEAFERNKHFFLLQTNSMTQKATRTRKNKQIKNAKKYISVTSISQSRSLSFACTKQSSIVVFVDLIADGHDYCNCQNEEKTWSKHRVMLLMAQSPPPWGCAGVKWQVFIFTFFFCFFFFWLLAYSTPAKVKEKSFCYFKAFIIVVIAIVCATCGDYYCKRLTLLLLLPHFECQSQCQMWQMHYTCGSETWVLLLNKNKLWRTRSTTTTREKSKEGGKKRESVKCLALESCCF